MPFLISNKTLGNDVTTSINLQTQYYSDLTTLTAPLFCKRLLNSPKCEVSRYQRGVSNFIRRQNIFILSIINLGKLYLTSRDDVKVA